MATAKEGPVLAVAAHAREFSGLLRHAGEASSMETTLSHASRARINGAEWILAANGEGPRCAAEAMRWALATSLPRAVVSTGYCGALVLELQVGDIWAAEEVVGESGEKFKAREPRTESAARRGAVLSIDRVASTAAEKARLADSGAGVVEMEAVAVAAAAESRGLPFYCVRVVSDVAGKDLPIDFNLYRDINGRVNTRQVARSAAWRPWIWPDMIRLARNATRASKALGEYLADCRF
jgi:adenosylhomocysteine nucleosidase